MYLVFKLPTDSISAAYANSLLDQELEAWSALYHIKYKSKIVKFNKRVTFDDERNYSFFSMTWKPKTKYYDDFSLEYHLLEPMNVLS